MRVGGRRRVRIPAHLGYRMQGVPRNIPPNALRVFERELLSEGIEPACTPGTGRRTAEDIERRASVRAGLFSTTTAVPRQDTP